MKRPTHETRLLDWFSEHETITQQEAYRVLGNTRLSATVFTLRQKGYVIVTEPTNGKNRYGEKTNYGTYRFLGKENVD